MVRRICTVMCGLWTGCGLSTLKLRQRVLVAHPSGNGSVREIWYAVVLLDLVDGVEMIL